MRVNIPVTFADYNNNIDFTESRAFFSAPFEKLAGFQIWGMTVLSQSTLHTEIRKYLSIEGDIYVSGMVSIVFPYVLGGSIKVALYNSEGVEFLEGPDGIVGISRSWGETPRDEKEYCTDFICDWPHGWGSLRIYSGPEIILSIDISDCIPIRRYVLEPEKYGYRV
ncbi:hypothetical protein [Brevibacillus porteri]|uniref:hypothetical protein n=1 Tax=Brevibacillus porteri TaxID=2126350 RepID=UPI003D23B45A